MADLKGCEGRVSPGGPNSFNFMQFFGKIWQNRMLAPPPLPSVGAPTSEKSWIRHCILGKNEHKFCHAILHTLRVWETKNWTERVTRVPRPSPDAPMDHTYPQLYFVSKRGSTLITAYSSSMFTFYVLANICKCVPVKIANSTFVVPLAFVPEKRKYPRL